jgi:disulfide bond formation protein DsbB
MASTRMKHTARRIQQAPGTTGAYRYGAFVLLTALAVILAALGFEHIGGYIPCPLCLQQRYAYYAGVPLAFMALVMVSVGRPRLAQVAFAVIALAFVVNAGLGVYQSGAEWKYWPGPTTCGTQQSIGGTGKGVLDLLAKDKVVRCDEAQWRMLGLSFAGWNAVASLVLAIGALMAAASQRGVGGTRRA